MGKPRSFFCLLASVIVTSQLLGCTVPIPDIIQRPLPTPYQIFPGSSALIEMQHLELYGLEVYIPSDWKWEEVNRRPESLELIGPMSGEDCADYLITNTDRSLELWLRPVCGFFQGGASTCGRDATIVKQWSSSQFILRWYNESSRVFQYSVGTILTVDDGSGPRNEVSCSNPPVLIFETLRGFTFVEIELQFLGNEADQIWELEAVDQIVTSIRKR
jgi:hypothetical protein